MEILGDCCNHVRPEKGCNHFWHHDADKGVAEMLPSIMYRVLLAVCVIYTQYVNFLKAESARGCYGEGLTIACKPDARINVLRDFYGYASGSGCSVQDDADCTLSVTPHESTARRRCNGISECTLTVERRVPCPSGSGHTNYHQIDFECIPDIYLNNVCHSKEWEAEGAYLVSPGYPASFPTNTDCVCSVTALNRSNSLAQILTLDFDMASALPTCKNWVEFNVSGREIRLCGRFTRRFSGRTLTVRFHSATSARKGFLLYAYGRPKSTRLRFRCGNQHDRSVDVVHGEDALFAARRMSMDARAAVIRPSAARPRPMVRPFRWRAPPRPAAPPNSWSGVSQKGSTDVIVTENRNVARWSRPPGGQQGRNMARNAEDNLGKKAVDVIVRSQPASHTPETPPARIEAKSNETSRDVQPPIEDLLVVHGELSFTKNGQTEPIGPPRIVSACFGGRLDLHCADGKIIRILDSFYGSNEDGRCSYEKNGCFRRPNQGFGVAEQTCNAKRSCSNLQVARVMCGEGYTSYQQVAYQCIPANVILDISDSFTGASADGYMASPRFPSLNPLPVSAHCTLSASDGKVRVQLVHLQLHEDGKCSNRFQIEYGQRMTTYCRPGSGSFIAEKIVISYHSNGKYSNSAVWLYFDAIDTPHVTVECNLDTSRPRSSMDSGAKVSPPSTPPPPVTPWGRSTSADADVFGHVPDELPSSERYDATANGRHPQNAAFTSTVSPFLAWQAVTAGRRGMGEDTPRRHSADSRRDATVDDTDGANEVAVQSWPAADSREYPIASIATPSDDSTLADKELPSASESIDFYQYQPTEDLSGPLISSVLKEFFGQSHVDPSADGTVEERTADGYDEMRTDQWLENRSSVETTWIAGTAETGGASSNLKWSDKESEVTSIAPAGDSLEYDSRRIEENADYLLENSVNKTANTSETSEKSSNSINQGSDQSMQNVSVGSTYYDVTLISDNLTEDMAKEDLYDRNRPIEYYSSWDYHDLASYESFEEGLDLPDGTSEADIVTEDRANRTADADGIKGKSSANKVHPSLNFVRWRHVVLICLVYTAIIDWNET